MMEVGFFPVPGDEDVIAAYFFGFGVQRLGDVADEVDQEFEGFVLCGSGEGAVLDTGGVVGDGTDDAALSAAVAGEGDGAGGWRGVFCVDEAGEMNSFSWVGQRVGWVGSLTGMER